MLAGASIISTGHQRLDGECLLDREGVGRRGSQSAGKKSDDGGDLHFDGGGGGGGGGLSGKDVDDR